MQGKVRHIKKAERTQKSSCVNEDSASILSPELREAIRSFMCQEWHRLRREELFMLRRGMKSEVEAIEREIGLTSE